MKRSLDGLGRITLPKGFRDQLGIKEGDEVDVEIINNQMVITSPTSIRTKEEIENQLKELEGLQEHSAYYEGYEKALSWVLNASNNK